VCTLDMVKTLPGVRGSRDLVLLLMNLSSIAVLCVCVCVCVCACQRWYYWWCGRCRCVFCIDCNTGTHYVHRLLAEEAWTLQVCRLTLM